ncbi:MAG: lysylphosphatidylglycerol synthase transmembrane domain-containing protein [Dongiaceae bacterium]
MRIRESIRPWALYSIRLLIGVGILIACFTLLDVSALPAAFARIDPLWLFVAFLMAIIGTIILPAMVTKRALEIDRIQLSLRELITLNFAVRFYMLTLPRAVSYGVRWVRYKNAGSGSDALALIVFEQLAQIFTMTSVSAAVLAFEYPKLGAEGAGLLLFMLGSVLFVATLLLPFFVPITTRWLVHAVVLGDRLAPAFIARRLHKLMDAVRGFHELKTNSVIILVALSFTSIAVMVLTWYVVAVAINIDVSLAAIAWVRGVLFVMLLSPITVGGIGIREAGTVGLLHLYGVPAHEALALSLTLFGAQVAIGLIGAIIEIWRYAVQPHLAKFTRAR